VTDVAGQGVTLPAPRTPDPQQAPPLRWGLLGAGWIADKFVTSLRAHTTQIPYAVWAPRPLAAAAFAQAHGIPHVHSSVADLLAAPDVDVVYVAGPHHSHHELTLAAIAAGKPVVVEKPLALNAAQAREIAAAASAAGVFVMEALWSVCLPKFDVVRQVLDAGVLGRIHTVTADIGEYFDRDHRILRRDLAGGPVLDLGTYPVAFATWILGAPSEVRALAQPDPSGVLSQTAAILRYDEGDHAGALALVHASLATATPTAGEISGDLGTLSLDPPFYQPGGVTLRLRDGCAARYDEPRIAHEGLYFEAVEAARCIAAGLTQSPLRPLADSIAMLAVMDEVRRQTGDVFDMEAGGIPDPA
jgi:predicted dehydrogenase